MSGFPKILCLLPAFSPFFPRLVFAFWSPPATQDYPLPLICNEQNVGTLLSLSGDCSPLAELPLMDSRDVPSEDPRSCPGSAAKPHASLPHFRSGVFLEMKHKPHHAVPIHDASSCQAPGSEGVYQHGGEPAAQLELKGGSQRRGQELGKGLHVGQGVSASSGLRTVSHLAWVWAGCWAGESSGPFSRAPLFAGIAAACKERGAAGRAAPRPPQLACAHCSERLMEAHGEGPCGSGFGVPCPVSSADVSSSRASLRRAERLGAARARCSGDRRCSGACL